MPCSDSKYSSLIVDYISGDLLKHKVSELVDHIESCRDCQDLHNYLLKFRSGLKRFESEEVKQHPATDRLVAFSEYKAKLDSNSRKQIEMHLLLCDQCQEEYETLQQLEQEIFAKERRFASGAKEGRNWLRNIVQPFTQLLSKPAFAYSVAAAAVLLMSITVFKSQEAEFPIAITTQQLSILTEQVRGTSEYTVVFRVTNDPIVRLAIASFWSDTAEYKYSVGIFDDEKREMLMNVDRITGLGNRGVTQFIVKTKSLEDERYRLIVTSVSKIDTTDFGQTAFLFELKTKG